MRENFVKSMQCKLKLKYMKNPSFGALHSPLPSQSEMQGRNQGRNPTTNIFAWLCEISHTMQNFACQTTSEDDFSGDEWLGFTFLGVMEARFSFKSLKITLNGQYLPESNGMTAMGMNQMAPLSGMVPKPNSQHGQEDNFNAYRSMRDRMHPPRMSAPSCIVPPTEQLVIRPHIVPLLPTFHGMESENPYSHIKEFEEVCNTFQEGGASIDLMRLKLFPFTLKDKAKIWLNSLRPRSKFELLAKENEKFYECWERYMEAINACPHHGFDTWLLVSYFYDGMSSSMKQLLETMCGGDFMSKNPEEAMDFLSYVAEVSRGWDEPNAREVGRMKSQPNAKGGMYVLNEDIDMKAKVAAMARRLEELEMKKVQEVQAISETQCKLCLVPFVNLMSTWWRSVLQFHSERDVWNHPNFSWKPKPPQYTQPAQAPQQASNLEQAIVNLSKVVGDFVGDQKSINAQLNQRIDSGEYIEQNDGWMQNDLSQKIDNVQYAISRLTNLNTVQEKGKFPSQPHQNPKGIHEVEAQEGESSKVREVKAVITLRSGKEVDQPTSKPKHDEESVAEKEKSEEIKEREKGKVNIPLLDMIKQVPTYAKFLKDLCTIKRGLNVNKKAFLTEQVSAIIQCKSPVKYKDPGCPTISVSIGGTCVEKALLDLGANRSVKIPRGMIEDVLVQVDKFYYPVDFVVLDTDPLNGVMQLTFGNMTLELNIFHLYKKHIHPEEEEGQRKVEVCILGRRQEVPVVISSALTIHQEDCLLEVLRRSSSSTSEKVEPSHAKVVRAEVLKLLQAGIIYPISDSPWVSPTQVVPKKSGITVVQNDKGEDVSTRLTTGWRVCIDYRRLNAVTRKDHFPLPFIDQVLERVSGHPFYCFLDGYSGTLDRN
ncbi:hypothetical protein CK203_113796 [Vitis vinifera]|uniref:Retrotransposon gag domain-containing protein n=1 Tax=Vitis vinifera TaxID=29760 RepID=A0A438FET9_VITVI|nr:hypothetical protein CK203_113796 [Vitis vinifera]